MKNPIARILPTARLTPCACAVLALSCAVFFPEIALARVVTDASLGRPSQALSGPAYRIPENLGKLSGKNLFHSFQTFSIDFGEIASFSTSTPNIANVISRVTGGEISTINGPITLVAAGGATPAFFFINPAGVVFGSGASINVPGAFHVGTADYIKFPDGVFFADLNKGSTFSSAAPEAFGFLGNHRSTLKLSAGADLVAYPGESISLVASDVMIDAARVKSDGGNIRIAATGQDTVVIPFTGDLPSGSGDLSIVRAGLVSTTTSCCDLTGSTRIQAGNILIDGLGEPSGNTGIFGSAAGSNGGGATLDIHANQSLSLLNGGTIAARTGTAANAGTINLHSPEVVIDNAKIDVASLDSGTAGSVTIHANNINLINGGQIWASAQSTGDGGSIKLTATDSIKIGGKNSTGNTSAIVVQTIDDARAGSAELDAPSIRIYDDGTISGYSGGSGAAGRVKINTRDLVLENGGDIYTFGLYTSGGQVAVDASNSITIRGKNEGPNSSPGADWVSTGILGHGTRITINSPAIMISESGAIRSENWYQASPGYINITTQRLNIQSGGEISGNALGHSYTPGIAAPININAAEYVRIEGSSNNRYSRIASAARSSGDAGSVRVTTPYLYLADGAEINSGTGVFGTAGAGSIDIAVDRLDILRNGGLTTHERGHTAHGGHISVIAREAITLDNAYISSTGTNEAQAGRIQITAPLVTIRDSTITTKNFEDATSGGVEITTNRLSLSEAARIESSSTGTHGAGNIALHVDGQVLITDSAVTTTSIVGSGGNILLDGGSGSRPSAVLLSNSVITTSVLGRSGNGGDISLNAGNLALDTGFIQANTVAANAAGGNININVNSLVPSGNILFVGGQTPYEFQSGLASFNVIQAAAPTGINGAINISTPAFDISGSLVGLSAKMMDAGSLGRSPCQTTGGSSLSQVGRGGFPASARNLLGPEEPIGTDPVKPARNDISLHAVPLTLSRMECAGE